jgi:hypothetical protein
MEVSSGIDFAWVLQHACRHEALELGAESRQHGRGLANRCQGWPRMADPAPAPDAAWMAPRPNAHGGADRRVVAAGRRPPRELEAARRRNRRRDAFGERRGSAQAAAIAGDGREEVASE